MVVLVMIAAVIAVAVVVGDDVVLLSSALKSLSALRSVSCAVVMSSIWLSLSFLSGRKLRNFTTVFDVLYDSELGFLVLGRNACHLSVRARLSQFPSTGSCRRAAAWSSKQTVGHKI